MVKVINHINPENAVQRQHNWKELASLPEKAFRNPSLQLSKAETLSSYLLDSMKNVEKSSLAKLLCKVCASSLSVSPFLYICAD
jgi:hypothetical protein